VTVERKKEPHPPKRVGLFAVLGAMSERPLWALGGWHCGTCWSTVRPVTIRTIAVGVAAVGLLFGVVYVAIDVSAALAVGSAAALLLCLAIPRLKLLAALTTLAMLFSATAEAVLQVPALGYADEGLLLLLLVLAVASRGVGGGELRRLPGQGWLALFVAAGATSDLVNDVPLLLGAASGFILLKGWLLAYALAQLDWTERDVQRAARFGAFVLAAAIGGLAANLVFGESWTALFNGSAFYSYRFGLPSQHGLFDAQLTAGNVMACAALLVLTHGWVFGTTAGHRLLLAGSVLGAVLSGRRTAAVGGVLGGVVAGLRQRPASTATKVVLLGPPILLASWSVIVEASASAYTDYVLKADVAARTIMHRDMFDVANDHFPFGAGFGRFGSHLAGQEYSPEYVARGYQWVWGLSEQAGNATFLTDTQWPTVLGETGYFGAVCALLALGCVALAGFRSSGAEDRVERWLGLGVIATFVVLVGASIGAPVFFGGVPPQVLFYGPLGLLVGYLAGRSDHAVDGAPVGAHDVGRCGGGAVGHPHPAQQQAGGVSDGQHQLHLVTPPPATGRRR
jgi:hypothetical protein